MAKRTLPARSGTKKVPRAPKRDRADTQLTVLLPRYVVEQVRAAVKAEPGATLRSMVLKAFAAAGYSVDAADMVDRRAEAARIRAELYRQYKAERGSDRAQPTPDYDDGAQDPQSFAAIA